MVFEHPSLHVSLYSIHRQRLLFLCGHRCLAMAWSTRTDASTLTRKGITTISIIIFTKLVNSQLPPLSTTSPSSTRTGSTSTTPTQTPTQAPPPSGVSAGAVAGIAIGCAVAGLVAGLLVACILLRRKKRRHSSKADAVATHHESKAYSPETSPPAPAAASDIQLGQFLPEATPDRDIAQEMQSLGGLIHQHVENYYHSRTVNASTRDLSKTLRSLGFKGQSSSPDTYTKNIAALCLDPKTRQSGLRHVITRAIFSSIGFHTQTSLPSMLPQPVASFLQAMPPDELGHSSDAQGEQAFLLLDARRKTWQNAYTAEQIPSMQQCRWPFADGAASRYSSCTRAVTFAPRCPSTTRQCLCRLRSWPTPLISFSASL